MAALCSSLVCRAALVEAMSTALGARTVRLGASSEDGSSEHFFWSIFFFARVRLDLGASIEDGSSQSFFFCGALYGAPKNHERRQH